MARIQNTESSNASIIGISCLYGGVVNISRVKLWNFSINSTFLFKEIWKEEWNTTDLANPWNWNLIIFERSWRRRAGGCIEWGILVQVWIWTGSQTPSHIPLPSLCRIEHHGNTMFLVVCFTGSLTVAWQWLDPLTPAGARPPRQYSVIQVETRVWEFRTWERHWVSKFSQSVLLLLYCCAEVVGRLSNIYEIR
mgnify:CR=1 FL=1